MLSGDAELGFSFVPLILHPREIPGLVKERDETYGPPKRQAVEARGVELSGQAVWTKALTDPFVADVFTWAKGTRNLERVTENPDLPALLHECSQKICPEAEPEVAAAAIWKLSQGIKQLGNSYASKLLRFLHPDDVVIFDSIIRSGLGLPDTERGYIVFHNACRTIQTAIEQEGASVVLSDVEAAIFMKLRKKIY